MTVRVPFSCKPGGGSRHVDGYVRVELDSKPSREAPVAISFATDGERVKTRFHGGCLWSPVTKGRYGGVSAYGGEPASGDDAMILHDLLRDSAPISGTERQGLKDRRPSIAWTSEGRRDLTDEPDGRRFAAAAANLSVIDGVVHGRSMGPALHLGTSWVPERRAREPSLCATPSLAGYAVDQRRDFATAFRCDRLDAIPGLLEEAGVRLEVRDAIADFRARLTVAMPECLEPVPDLALATLGTSRQVMAALCGLPVRSAPRAVVELAYDMRLAIRDLDGFDPYGDPYGAGPLLFGALDPRGAEGFAGLLERAAAAEVSALLDETSVASLRLVIARGRALEPVDELDLQAIEGIGHGF